MNLHDGIRIDAAADVLHLLAGNDRKWPSHSNRASQIGHPCARLLTYQRTHWEDFASIDDGLLGIFATGNELEPIIERVLSKAGGAADPRWRIVGGQAAMKDRFLRDYEITGHIDGILQVHADDHWINWAVADIKTCSDYTFDGINTAADLVRPLAPSWMRGWRSQLNIYAFGNDLERCVLILVRKSNLFDVKMIWFDLDLEHVQGLLDKAAAINKAVADWKINGDDSKHPPKINKPESCGKCKIAHICNPVLQLDPGAQFIDEDIITLLDERAELHPLKKRFDVVDRGLKANLPTGPLIFCGDHVIEGLQVFPAGKKPYWKRTYTKADDQKEATA